MWLNSTQLNLEEGKFLQQKAQKNFRASGKNRTHDPPGSSLDIGTFSMYS